MYYSKNFWTKLKYRKKHQGRENESISPDSEFPSWKRNKCLNRDVEHLWQAINEEKFTSSFDNHTPSDFVVATGLWRNRYWAIRCTISKLRFHLSNRLNEKNKKTKKTMSYHHLQQFSCQDLMNWSSCCTLSSGSLYSFHCSPSASPHKPRTRLRRKGEAYRRICWSWSMVACRPN